MRQLPDVEALLGPASPLVARLPYTWMAAVDRPHGEMRETTFRGFLALVENTDAGDRTRLPLASYVRFRGDYRNNANFIEAYAIVADHDAGKLTLYGASRRLREARVAHIGWTTGRHTPEHPRWRILTKLRRPAGPKAYAGLVDRLAGVLKLALPKECYTLDQPWYYGGVAGKPLATVIENGRYLDDLPDLSPRSRHAPAPRRSDDLLTVARMRPCGFSEKQVAMILDHLPDRWRNPYWPWLRVGMALHHEYEGGDEGLALWDAFSQESAFYDADEIERKWRGFGAYDDQPARMATLLMFARRSKLWSETRFRAAATLKSLIKPVKPVSMKSLLRKGRFGR